MILDVAPLKSGIALAGRFNAEVGASALLAAEFGLSLLLIGSLGVLPPSLGMILSIAFVLGILIQGAQAGLNALVAEFYSTAIRAMGWALGVGRIGSIVGPILGGIMLSLQWDLQQIVLAGTVPARCAGLAILAGSRLQQASTALPSLGRGSISQRVG